MHAESSFETLELYTKKQVTRAFQSFIHKQETNVLEKMRLITQAMGYHSVLTHNYELSELKNGWLSYHHLTKMFTVYRLIYK